MRKALPSWTICLILAIVAFGPFNLTVPSAQGHAPDVSLSAFAPTAPTIDGTIEEAEWDGAAIMDFAVPDGLHGTIFVMNDLTTLYVAVRLPAVNLVILFDDDHDGVTEKREDVLAFTGSVPFDWFIADFAFYTGTQIINPSTLTLNPDQSSPGGTTDGLGKSDGFGSFESSHPLCSRDTDLDFCLSVGDIVGFQIFDPDTGSWPGSFLDTSQWGDIAIAAPHTVLVLGSMRGIVGGWAFGAVEDDPSTHTVVYGVPGDILSFDREDTQDLVHLAMAAPTCTFPGQCVVETANPDVTYTLSSLDSFTLTFEFVSTRFVVEIPAAPLLLAFSCTVNLSSLTDRCVFSRTPDLNSDSSVNILDVTLVAKAFGSKTGLASYDSAADLNGDDMVNILDLTILAGSFGAQVFK